MKFKFKIWKFSIVKSEGKMNKFKFYDWFLMCRKKLNGD